LDRSRHADRHYWQMEEMKGRPAGLVFVPELSITPFEDEDEPLCRKLDEPHSMG
jgi:predicted amidohydrolase